MQKVILALLLWCFAFTGVVTAQTVNYHCVDGKLYIKVKNNFPDTLSLGSLYLSPIASLYQIDSCYRPYTGLNSDSLERTYCIRFRDTAKTQKCMDTLRTMVFVDYVEQVPLYRTSLTPNDFNGNQWYLDKINARQAWDVTHGSPAVVIAIVDNGVRTTHEDLANNLWVNSDEIAGNGLDDDFNGFVDDRNGYDLADRDGNPNPPTGISNSDPFNHGTHCAGIASAATNNGKGIAGVGFSAKIMAVKCTSNADSGNILTNTMDGVVYAVKNGANIISMSFGSDQNSTTEQLVLNSARNQGVVLIAAAGNSNSSTPEYPAALPGVISVGATNNSDQRASFSNFGSTVDIMAPGVGIYSTLASSNTAYGSLSGTSMATPMVAGLASLVLAQHPGFTPDQVEAQLKSTADNIAGQNPGQNGQLGAGRINASRAVGGVSTINETGNEPLLKIYPNPTSGAVTVYGASDAMQLRVTDFLGALVCSTSALSATYTLNLSAQPAGVYFIEVTGNNFSAMHKLVLQH